MPVSDGVTGGVPVPDGVGCGVRVSLRVLLDVGVRDAERLSTRVPVPDAVTEGSAPGLNDAVGCAVRE